MEDSQMKRLTIAAVIVLFAAPGAFAANRTLTGKISDSMCGLSHKAMIEHGGGKMTDAQCTDACVKAGAKYVFASGGKVYAIANQDEKDLATNAGKTVRLAGDVEGETITVSKITAPAKATKKPKKT
jgi:hypothetical protein